MLSLPLGEFAFLGKVLLEFFGGFWHAWAMPKNSPATEESEKSLSALRLRVYLLEEQKERLNTWLQTRHAFRNEAANWLADRRRRCALWIKENPGQKIPEHLHGDGCKQLSAWLTQELEKARNFAVREFALTVGKQQQGEAFAKAWSRLSWGERDEMRERCEAIGIRLEWIGLNRSVLDQVVRDLSKTCSKAIKDRTERKKALLAQKKGGKNKGKQASKGKAASASSSGVKSGKNGQEKRVKQVKVAGFPKARKYHYPGSIRIQVDEKKNTTFHLAWAAGEIVVPGIGRLKVRESGYAFPKTPPKMITLSRNAAGQFHATFVCVEGEGLSSRARRLQQEAKLWNELPKDALGFPAIEGLDMSLPDLVVSNQHGKMGRIRHLEQYARRMRQANKAVSRKRKGSGRWKKACRRLGKLHTRVADVREATLRKAANQIADRSAIVCVETLRLAFMAQNPRLAKSVHDLGWASFHTYLEQAMAARGHLLLHAHPFSPTTQACSSPGCDYRNPSLKGSIKNNLKIRAWDCPKCGQHHDRDINAAHNIQNDAIRMFVENPGAESALVSRKLHPELAAYLARGGMTALSPSQDGAESRFIRKGEAPVSAKRELPPKPAKRRLERQVAG